MKDWSHLTLIPAPLERAPVGYLLDKQRHYNAEMLKGVFETVRAGGYQDERGLTMLKELVEIRRYLHLAHDDDKQIRWKDLVGQLIHVPWLDEGSYVVDSYVAWHTVFVKLPDGRVQRRRPELAFFESLLRGPKQVDRLKSLHEYEVKKKLRLASLETKKDDQGRHNAALWDYEPERRNDAGS